ncbi:unnamed protein product, partial [Rotaria magnacalcarata]
MSTERVTSDIQHEKLNANVGISFISETIINDDLLSETIQAGLFLASDQVLSNSGLAGSLISYVIISIMVYFVMTNL